MFQKLNTSMETRNYLGLSEESLDNCSLSLDYEYIEVPCEDIEFDKSGEVLALSLPGMNIRRYRGVAIEVNPDLFEIGTVSYNPILGSGPQEPKVFIRAYKKGLYQLEWLARVRLLNG